MAEKQKPEQCVNARKKGGETMCRARWKECANKVAVGAGFTCKSGGLIEPLRKSPYSFSK